MRWLERNNTGNWLGFYITHALRTDRDPASISSAVFFLIVAGQHASFYKITMTENSKT